MLCLSYQLPKIIVHLGVGECTESSPPLSTNQFTDRTGRQPWLLSAQGKCTCCHLFKLNWWVLLSKIPSMFIYKVGLSNKSLPVHHACIHKHLICTHAHTLNMVKTQAKCSIMSCLWQFDSVPLPLSISFYNRKVPICLLNKNTSLIWNKVKHFPIYEIKGEVCIQIHNKYVRKYLII